MPLFNAINNGGVSLQGPASDGTNGQVLVTDGSGQLLFAGNTYTDAEQTKVGYLTVTGAVDLDSVNTRVNELDAAITLQGTWDASSGSFPGGGTAQAGESWIVSVGGTLDGVVFTVDDRIIAISDNASTSSSADWHKADYTDLVQSVAGLTGAITAADLADAVESELSITESQISDFDSSDYLLLAGGTLTGDLNLGSNDITNAGTVYSDAVDTDIVYIRAGTAEIRLYDTVAPVDADDYARITFNNGALAYSMWDDSASSFVFALLYVFSTQKGTLYHDWNVTGDLGVNEASPDYALDVNGSFGFTPGTSVTPADNGDVVFEFTDNTTITVKGKGTDGTVRSGTISIA